MPPPRRAPAPSSYFLRLGAAPVSGVATAIEVGCHFLPLPHPVPPPISPAAVGAAWSPRPPWPRPAAWFPRLPQPRPTYSVLPSVPESHNGVQTRAREKAAAPPATTVTPPRQPPTARGQTSASSSSLITCVFPLLFFYFLVENTSYFPFINQIQPIYTCFE
jgi:hypothetical protein